jgi:hypothetical protein
MRRALLLTPLLALALAACGDKDSTDIGAGTGGTGDVDDSDTDDDPGTGGGTGGEDGGGTGGDPGGGEGGDPGGGEGGDPGGGEGGDPGGGEDGGDEGGDSRDLSPYAGDWSGDFTMSAVATDGSGLSDSCSGVLTFTVDPDETSGPPILGEFTCSWAGPLSEMEGSVDPVFAGGTPGLPDVEGVIMYGPFELDWTGTASASEWSGTYAGTYAFDSSVPQLPASDISGTWSASPVTR